MAILKILQLIVSGRIPRPAGEDYLVSVCRLVRHGGSGLGISAATRRALGVALAEVKLADQGTTTCTNLQAMRAWRGKRTIIRAVLLLNALERSVGPVALVAWLQRPNPNLGRRPPVDLMRADQWLTLADFLDDMLTGSPS